MLRLEAPDKHMSNNLSFTGIWCLGDCWRRGVFGPLEEFSLRGHARIKDLQEEWKLMEAFLRYWREAPAATFGNLQVHPWEVAAMDGSAGWIGICLNPLYCCVHN